MRYRASPAQRDLALLLMRKAGLDLRTVSLMHRASLERAGLWAGGAENGKSVDELLGGLTNGEASRFIDALKALYPEGKGDA